MPLETLVFIIVVSIKILYFARDAWLMRKLSQLAGNDRRTKRFLLSRLRSSLVISTGDLLWLLLVTGILSPILTVDIGRGILGFVFTLVIGLLPILIHRVEWTGLDDDDDPEGDSDESSNVATEVPEVPPPAP